ncbi:hypothetical protein GOZ92_11375 [Agrobacterium vitis]|nr:hypothetical protein [Agrobacterium vitis]
MELWTIYSAEIGRTLHDNLQREGFDVPRCTVARLMKSMCPQGNIRGKPIRTTFSAA